MRLALCRGLDKTFDNCHKGLPETGDPLLLNQFRHPPCVPHSPSTKRPSKRVKTLPLHPQAHSFFVPCLGAELQAASSQVDPYILVETLVVGTNKILMETESQSQSVHAFVDKKTGEVYKAASYKSPAKGVRFDLRIIEQREWLFDNADCAIHSLNHEKTYA